jgi:hypothetical protein
MPIRQLTHRGQDGQPYHRRPEIEAQIAATAALPADELGRRASIADEQHPEYLRDEALFYHLREAAHAGNRRLLLELWQPLNQRCCVYARFPLRSLSPQDAEDALGNLLEKLVRLIDSSGDDADYCEVSFRQFFSSRARDAYGKANNERNRQAKQATLADDREFDSDDGAAHSAHVEGGGWDPEDVVRGIVGEQALRELELYFHGDRRLYQAFLLRHYEGRAIGPRETTGTISNLFGVTEKTINNWMRKVEAFLAEWRKRNLK